MVHIVNFITLLTFLSITVASDKISETTNHLCVEYQSCGRCIASGCSWCKQESYSLDRCNMKKNLINCSDEHVVSSSTTVSVGSPSLDAVQMSPQNVTIRLRPNSIATFNITFRQAVDYPVDLYFLMDVSNSMEPLKRSLVNLSDTLATTLRSLTMNYHLGLGTFMDKATMPYFNTEVMSSWCPNCVKPYSFRNHLSLTNNISSFQSEVNVTQYGGNLDRPEGVFDGLMQTVVCAKNIGWRDQSRKLVVLSTDGDFHYGGDGLVRIFNCFSFEWENSLATYAWQSSCKYHGHTIGHRHKETRSIQLSADGLQSYGGFASINKWLVIV